MRERVAVTACGIISPAGTGLPGVMESIGGGRPGTGEIRNFDASGFPSHFCAEAREEAGVAPRASSVDRKEVFLAGALRQIAASGALGGTEPARRHLFVGMGLDYFDLPGFAEGGGRWQDYSANTLDLARRLAAEFSLGGEVAVNVNACVAGSQALGLAFRYLREAAPGSAVVAGGADSMLNPLHYMGFHKLGALSSWEGAPEEACRPFDRERSGLVLGEGAALYVLRRAGEVGPGPVLAQIRGYASTMDAYMVTDPEPSGRALAAAAREALADAGLEPGDVDCVHLHGTGTPKNDAAEARAMELVFGGRGREIPVYSMKGQVGHLIAGCGAVELAGVLFSLLTQSVPPTINFRVSDPEVPLRVVSGRPLPLEVDHVLKLNAAFGGQNTALVVSRHAA